MSEQEKIDAIIKNYPLMSGKDEGMAVLLLLCFV
jgi:hypothetical protein